MKDNASQASIEPVVYFFCDYKVLPTLDDSIIIGSLLFQLAMQDKIALSLLKSVRTTFETKFGKLAEVPADHLSAAFSKIVSCFRTISIIIDGLDECSHHLRISQRLSTLSGGTALLRTLIFSRDEPDIRKILKSKGFNDCSVEADNDDMKTYVAAQIDDRLKSNELVLHDDNLKLKIQEKLTSGAKGMWV